MLSFPSSLEGDFLGCGSRMGETHFLQLTLVQQAELPPLFQKERGWTRLGVVGVSYQKSIQYHLE